MNGTSAKQYTTDGATDVFMVSVFTAPIGAKLAGDVKGPQDVKGVQTGSSPGPGSGDMTPGVRVEQNEQTVGGATKSVMFVVRKPDGDGKSTDNKPGDGKQGEGMPPETKDVVILGENCPEPTRTGEATIAGRAVFVIQNDFSSCVPADAPDAMRG